MPTVPAHPTRLTDHSIEGRKFSRLFNTMALVRASLAK